MKRLTLLILFFLASPAFAGGGWVGNSPVEVAYQPASIGPEATMSTDALEENVEWNSLLLPKGQRRVELYYKNENSLDAGTISWFDLGFDYGLTNRLTMFSGIDWGYSLLSDNGRGNELALYFGLLGGGNYTSYTGLVLDPGVGLGYAYSTSKWRTTWRSDLTSTYQQNTFYGMRSQTTGDFTYWITPKFGIGASATYYAHLDYSKSGWVDRSVFGVFQLSKQWQLTAIYDPFRDGVGAGAAFTW